MSDFSDDSSGQKSSRKAEIRARLLARRRALSPEQRRAAAARVQAALTPVVATASAAAAADAVGAAAGTAGGTAGGTVATVAGYVPFGTEPGGVDLPAVLARALGPGGRLLLPVLREDRDLDWAVHGDLTSPPLPATTIREAVLVVVPAVAVDQRGVRLGRGGGSYDRALARVAPGTEVVALLHDGELLADPLPADPHDRPVTAVITPTLGLHRL